MNRELLPSDDDYPVWVCSECGNKAQKDKRRIHAVATFHSGWCEVCDQYKAVTEPRDFGYPVFDRR